MAQIIKPRLKLSLNHWTIIIELATTITKHTQKARVTPTAKATAAISTTATKIRITVKAAEKIINKQKNN